MPKHISRPKRLKLDKIFNLKSVATVATAIVFLALILLPISIPKPVLAWTTCGDTVDFTYRGSPVTYGTVEHNGECWLDRNLGATKVAESYNDCVLYPSDCAYGDLFQWGRLDDNHQDRSSGITTTLSPDLDDPGHPDFIYGMGSPYDWRDPKNDNLWQGASGINNPCPSGWRIPTKTEWETERTSWVTVDGNTNDRDGAFASPLKLTAAGYRIYNTATLVSEGSVGYYWSSAVDGSNAHYLYFTSGGADTNSTNRANGFSVRCIKDTAGEEEAVPEFTTVTLIIAAVAGFGIYFVIKRTKQKAAK